jgi:hypothetical protein
MSALGHRGKRHRMPVVFGPSTGPRQGPGGEGYDYSDAPRTTVAVSFLTQAEALQALLPPGCQLDGEPVVTVEHTELRELEWLAGRGYSMLGVKFPVVFQGKNDHVRGPFLSVLWENRPEPIISGREELGFAKLYCELPTPRVIRDDKIWVAAWDNHIFATLTLTGLKDASPSAPAVPIDGMLHYRYLPRLGEPGHAEVEQMVMSPAGAKMQILSYQEGTPSIDFVRSTWEQLPTMYNIVNTLADLPILEMRSGWLAETKGGGDLSDQRVIE